jgi:hypothetical protein
MEGMLRCSTLTLPSLEDFLQYKYPASLVQEPAEYGDKYPNAHPRNWKNCSPNLQNNGLFTAAQSTSQNPNMK